RCVSRGPQSICILDGGYDNNQCNLARLYRGMGLRASTERLFPALVEAQIRLAACLLQLLLSTTNAGALPILATPPRSRETGAAHAHPHRKRTGLHVDRGCTQRKR